MRCFISRLTYAVVKVLLKLKALVKSLESSIVSTVFNLQTNSLDLSIKLPINKIWNETRLESVDSALLTWPSLDASSEFNLCHLTRNSFQNSD
jgi:hypothetical protein